MDKPHRINHHAGLRARRTGFHFKIEALRVVSLLGGVRPSAVGGELGRTRPDNLVRGVGRRDGGSDGLRLSLDECEALRSQGKSRRRNGLLGHEHIERSGHIADLDGDRGTTYI